MTDEAAVLGWALTQAGVKIVDPKKKDQVAEDPLAFPAADAGKSTPPTPKVAPKNAQAKVAPPAVEEEEEEVEAASVEEAAAAAEEEEEPELSETVDKIKNDNNVVVFFCKYKTTFDREMMHPSCF